jgi:hypothetical protein
MADELRLSTPPEEVFRAPRNQADQPRDVRTHRSADTLATLLSVGWMVSLVCAFWQAATTPKAGNYDVSLPAAFPPTLWWLVLLATVCACGLLLLISQSPTRNIAWLSGFTGVVATNSFILSLPLFRGYAVADRTDAMNHIGYMKDIAITRHLGTQDFYPAQHLLQYALQYVAHTTPGEALIIINITFDFVWVAGITMLAARLAGTPQAKGIGTAFAAPFALLIYQSYTLPSVVSAMLLPVLLAFYLSSRHPEGPGRLSWTVASIALATLLVFYHPVTAIYAVVAFVAWEFGGLVSVREDGAIRLSRESSSTPSNRLGLSIIITVVLLAWAFSFSVITSNTATLLKWLQGEQDRASAIGEASSLVSVSKLPLSQLLSILWNGFGLTAVIPVLTVAMWAYCLRNRARFAFARERLFWRAGVTYFAVLALSGSMFFVSTSERNPIRLLRVDAILGISFLAWWLYYIAVRPELPRSRRAGDVIGLPLRQGWRLAAVALALVAALWFGQRNVYPGPANGQPNQYVSHGELAGMKWLLTHRVRPFRQASILPDYTSRYASYYYGYFGRRALGPGWWRTDLWLPSHFYGDKLRCAASLSRGVRTYLALSEAGRMAPLRLPADVRRYAHIYDVSDWRRLGRDNTVDKVYDNGGFQVWTTSGVGECP